MMITSDQRKAWRVKAETWNPAEWGPSGAVLLLLDALKEAEAAIQRVRDEHEPRRVQTGSKTHGGGPQFGDVCSCGRPGPYRDCPTVRALGGAT